MLGKCIPKNITDHKMFKTSCIIKIKIIFVFCHEPDNNFCENLFHAFILSELILFFTSQFFDQTKYKEIPIKTNKIVHTGPKIQLGGLKKGLFKPLYHDPICEIVKTEPIIPANSQIITLTKNFNRLL